MVFDRVKYKDFAKKQLHNRWLVPVLMTAVISIITLIFAIPDYTAMVNSDEGMKIIHREYSNFGEFIKLFDKATASQSSFLIDLVQFIVGAILDFAAINVYLKMSRSPEDVPFSSFIEGLNNWWKAIKAFFWQFAWVLLWSFLFIIPGIIKAIAYSQMYYILCEFENVSVTKAMKISILITKGHKTELFTTYLSFLGWFILAMIPCGLGMIWLKPYMNMTFVNVYHALMKNALETGIIRPEDLQ